MKMKQFISNDIEDYKAVERAIKDYMLKATDPDAWHTEKMFEKLKQKPDLGFDTEAWDTRSEWIPRGTKITDHPWDDAEQI